MHGILSSREDRKVCDRGCSEVECLPVLSMVIELSAASDFRILARSESQGGDCGSGQGHNVFCYHFSVRVVCSRGRRSPPAAEYTALCRLLKSRQSFELEVSWSLSISSPTLPPIGLGIVALFRPVLCSPVAGCSGLNAAAVVGAKHWSRE
jgi:hypothetical protein